jgi:hypothetical protein
MMDGGAWVGQYGDPKGWDTDEHTLPLLTLEIPISGRNILVQVPVLVLVQVSSEYLYNTTLQASA